jgi:hypothetical protein
MMCEMTMPWWWWLDMLHKAVVGRVAISICGLASWPIPRGWPDVPSAALRAHVAEQPHLASVHIADTNAAGMEATTLCCHDHRIHLRLFGISLVLMPHQALPGPGAIMSAKSMSA